MRVPDPKLAVGVSLATCESADARNVEVPAYTVDAEDAQATARIATSRGEDGVERCVMGARVTAPHIACLAILDRTAHGDLLSE
jgi:hypothetical protein